MRKKSRKVPNSELTRRVKERKRYLKELQIDPLKTGTNKDVNFWVPKLVLEDLAKSLVKQPILIIKKVKITRKNCSFQKLMSLHGG